MRIMTGRKHRILVFAILGIILFASLGEKVLASGLNGYENEASAKETLIKAYNNFNYNNYVYVEYTKNKNNHFVIEIDHKNKIKHIVLDPFKYFKRVKEGSEEKKQSYFDYKNSIKYYWYTDEGPKQSEVELKEDAETKNTSDEKTAEWVIDKNGLDLKWKEEIGEIKSLYDDKVYYIGLKDTPEYSIEYEEDSLDKIIMTYENNSYNYTLNSSGFLKSVTINSGEEEITMDFEYKDDEVVVIPDEYANVKEKNINASEEEQNTETINNSEEDTTTATEENTKKNSFSKKNDGNYPMLIVIIVIVIVIIVVLLVVLKKKKAKRKALELKRKKEEDARVSRQKREELLVSTEEKLTKRELFKLKFTVTDGDKKKEELYHELKRGESVIVGRSDMSSVVIEDPMLSRQHFMISFDEDDLYIEDLDTTNGTMINGNKITRRTKLTQHDVVGAGNYDIRIDW